MTGFARKFAGLMFATALAAGAVQAKDAEAATPADLFQSTNVFTAHFTFTPEQWSAMEPDSPAGFGIFGAGGGRPGAPRGAFGPGTFVAPAFLKAADSDQNHAVTRAEFRSLAEKWFAAWDKDQSGKLKNEEIRDGLNDSLGAAAGPPRINLQGPAGKRNGLASAMGIEFNYVQADLELHRTRFTNVAVRYKGNGTFLQSRGSLKRSLKVDLNEYVKGQKIAGLSKLNFHNCVTDASWMNEVLSHRLYRDAGVPAPRTAYARVYVTVPGKHNNEYFGLYSLVENVDSNFIEERFGTRNGALFKPVTHDLFTYLGPDWAKYKQTYDPKTDLSQAQAQRVIDFARLVSQAADEEFAASAGEYLDLPEFARYIAVTVWLSTLDSIFGPGQNYYLYVNPKSGKFQFIPWDLDHSFGQFPLIGTQEQREKLSIQKPWQGEKLFLQRVFKLDEFQKHYRDCLDRFSKTVFRPERFQQQVDEIAAAIRPAVADESREKFERFSKVVSGESASPPPFGAPPSGAGNERADVPRFERPGGMMQPLKPIKPFVVARAKSIQEQLAGDPGLTVDAPAFTPPRGFGPGMFLARTFETALDENQDGELSRDEFIAGFARWFDSWDTEKSGALGEEQIRAGLNNDLPFGMQTGPAIRPFPPRED